MTEIHRTYLWLLMLNGGNVAKTVTDENILHCVPKNLSTFLFFEWLKNLPILMSFGMWNPKIVWHQNLIKLPTSPTTLPWEIPKSHFQQYC